MIVEIRAAEGGDDAKLLVEDQAGIYCRLAAKNGLSVETVDKRPGICVLRVLGTLADGVFANESGGHRWQRIPPTERNGRVQTSTITVATFPEPTEAQFEVKPSDLDWKMTRGSGPGGQHRNKVESCVVLTHRPTGITVRCENERSQYRNKQTALAILTARLYARDAEAKQNADSLSRRSQVGTGQRGDKRRTIRVRDGRVHDHVTGAEWQYARYVKGEW